MEGMMQKKYLLTLAVLSFILSRPAASPHVFVLNKDALVQVSLPVYPTQNALQESGDLDGDGSNERLVLLDNRLEIIYRNETAWQSPSSWQVTQAGIADLNADGRLEAVLLLWRPFRPWPVDRWLPHGNRIANFHDADGLSCHIILVGWKDREYREIWAGSPLAEPVTSFSVADLDGDKVEELITLQGSYSRPRTTSAHALQVWDWNGFGFSSVSSLQGNYEIIVPVQDQFDRVMILVP
jgi:hypothetical protein